MCVLAVASADCRRERAVPVADDGPSIVDAGSSGHQASAPASNDPSLPNEEADRAVRDAVVRSHVAQMPDAAASPERFAKSMTGTVDCGAHGCRAGREVCVASPSPSHVSHCETIAEWIDRRTPRPRDGFPPLAGITACSGSHNCPTGTVCCLHEIGAAEVQAIVCHASLSECRDQTENCTKGVKGDCRTPGTKCVGYQCTTP
jgi:hypothetical protein